MIERPREFTDKDRRVFGLVLGGLLLLAAFFSWRKGGFAWPALLGLGAASSVLALADPAALAPLLKVWMRAAGVMAKVNTFLLMGVMWTVIFIPLALLMRLLKTGLLDLGRGPKKKTYWLDHKARSTAAYKRLF